MTDIPEDVMKAAKDALHAAYDEHEKLYPMTNVIFQGLWDRFYDAAALAILAEREARRERDAKLLEEGYDLAVATRYRADGLNSKIDQCQHGRYMYEDCEACAAIAIRAA